jgi:hypothetical protein
MASKNIYDFFVPNKRPKSDAKDTSYSQKDFSLNVNVDSNEDDNKLKVIATDVSSSIRGHEDCEEIKISIKENISIEQNLSKLRSQFETLDDGWRNGLIHEFSKGYFKRLEEFLEIEYNRQTIYPPVNQIFNALKLCPYESVKGKPDFLLTFYW